MTKDWDNRESEIDAIEHIIAATIDSKYFTSWEDERYVLQWLFNQRQGVVLEPLDDDCITLLMYIIADRCDESVFYETMKWFVNHVKLGEESK